MWRGKTHVKRIIRVHIPTDRELCEVEVRIICSGYYATENLVRYTDKSAMSTVHLYLVI